MLEAGADREHGVGAFPTLHGSRLGHRQRMTVVQDAPAHAVRDHGRLQVLRDVAQRLPRVTGAPTGHDEGVPGRCKELCRLFHRFGIGGDGRLSRCRFAGVDVGHEPQHVRGRFDSHGARCSGSELVERSSHPRCRLRGMLDASRPLGEPLQNRELVGDLVQQPIALADGV